MVAMPDEENSSEPPISEPEQRDLEGEPTGQATFNVEEDDA